MREHLVEVAQGIWANPAETGFEEKLMRHGKLVPNSPFHEASILKEAGKYREAKAVYRKLLSVKESYHVHQQLAALCGLTEALQMAHTYRDKKVRALYYNRVLQLDPTNKYARRFFSHRFTKLVPWLFAIILLALFLALLFSLVFNRFEKRVTTVSTTITNHVYYVDDLGTEQHYMGTIVAPSMEQESIVDAVDSAGMQPGDVDSISTDSDSVVGYAKYQGNGTYQIYILNTAVPKTTTTNSTALPVSPVELNTIRTAYDYYLQTHEDVPPRSISDLSPYLPPRAPITRVAYHPELVTPEKAIAEPDNAAVPFQKPYMLVNTSERTLLLKYGSQTLLKSPVGVGAPDQPTPVGVFTVTDCQHQLKFPQKHQSKIPRFHQ